MSIEADVLAAIKAIEQQRYEPSACALGRHLVSPTTKQRGYGRCVNCGARVGRWPQEDTK